LIQFQQSTLCGTLHNVENRLARWLLVMRDRSNSDTLPLTQDFLAEPLIELRAFEAAARHLSFKKAAAELGVTPTAISHQIRLLEGYCGRPLFRRRPRPLVLTDVGARLFPVIRDGLEAFATAIAGVKRDAGKEPLRVTTTNAFASRWLVPRLARWRKQRPNMPLEVIGTDAVLDLRAGDADVAIRNALTAPADGVAKELFRDTFWPVCSPHLLLNGGPLKRAADLRRHVLIHFHWPPFVPQAPTWQRWLDTARSRWRDVPAIDEMGHLNFREELHAIEAVIAGQGIGICSDVLVAHELQSRVLVKASDLRLPGYGFYLVHTTGHPRQKAIDALSAWLRSVK
jgi:LysR family glycine cleavage system transcriptional activator